MEQTQTLLASNSGMLGMESAGRCAAPAPNQFSEKRTVLIKAGSHLAWGLILKRIAIVLSILLLALATFCFAIKPSDQKPDSAFKQTAVPKADKATL